MGLVLIKSGLLFVKHHKLDLKFSQFLLNTDRICVSKAGGGLEASGRLLLLLIEKLGKTEQGGLDRAANCETTLQHVRCGFDVVIKLLLKGFLFLLVI